MVHRSLLTAGLAVTFSVTALGCGGDAESRPPAVHLPALTICPTLWTQLSPEWPHYGPRALAADAGRVFFSLDYGSFIGAVSEDGTVTFAASKPGAGLWMENHALFFANSNQLFSLAPNADTPTKVIDGGPISYPHWAYSQALDSSFFYWLDADTFNRIVTKTFWRMPRTGGTSEMLGSLTSEGVGPMWLASDGLIVTANPGHTLKVPFDGGSLQVLADVEAPNSLVSFAGGDATGAYWTIIEDGAYNGQIPVHRVVRVPASGGPLEPFWPTAPTTVMRMAVWPDDRGGWVVDGFQIFDDGFAHEELWSIDPSGAARLLACDRDSYTPEANDPKVVTINARPAFTDDAIYLVVNHPQKPTTDGVGAWMIVKALR